MGKRGPGSLEQVGAQVPGKPARHGHRAAQGAARRAERRLRRARGRGNGQRGPVGSQADCLVGYGIGGNYVVDGGYGPGWGYGYYGYGSGYYGWGGPYVYREGIIAVDLYDAKSRQPMWHASADQSLFNASGPQAEKLIDEADAAIFSKRPPGA